MRVLVTGAGGTLGRALAPALAHKGHEPVLFDIQAFETPYPVVQGDIRSLSTWSHPSLSPWTMAPSSGATPSRSSIGNGRAPEGCRRAVGSSRSSRSRSSTRCRRSADSPEERSETPGPWP